MSYQPNRPDESNTELAVALRSSIRLNNIEKAFGNLGEAFVTRNEFEKLMQMTEAFATELQTIKQRFNIIP